MTEMEPKQWHWQERYDATIPPREAMSQKRQVRCQSSVVQRGRKDMLHSASFSQVHKGIPYDKWLAMKQHKEAAMRATYNGGDEGDEANKRAKSDAAFREWCARKNRELREKMLTNEDQSPNKVCSGFSAFNWLLLINRHRGGAVVGFEASGKAAISARKPQDQAEANNHTTAQL